MRTRNDGVPRPGFLHGNRFDFQTASFRTRLRDLAAHAREFYPERPALRDQRAQGMPGARCARSLVCKVESTRVVTPESPGIPRAMVLTVSFVPGDRACSPPSSANSRPRHPSAPKVSAGLKCRSAEDLAKAESVARLRAGASRLTSVTITRRPSEALDIQTAMLDLVPKRLIHGPSKATR